MNDFWTTVGWSSAQVTLVAAAALIMERVASRRGPRAGAWVAAASLFFIALIAPLAFGEPAKGWIDLGTGNSKSIAERRVFATARPAPGLEAGTYRSQSRDTASSQFAGFWGSFLGDRLRAFRAWGEFAIPANPSAPIRAWGMFLSLGATLGLCRLAVGLWGVRQCRRRAVPVKDPELIALVSSLRAAIGCRRKIEVRELRDRAAGGAAAIGWLRPVILLPSGWRDWPGADIRAVLAHEVAHIASSDYATGVVARLGLALHFYHPLVHWTVARLLLQQELAADAQGARLVGGSRTYLRALSRLALRLEERSWASPAKMFLPARGQLIRRIHVLKSNRPRKDASLSPLGRAVSVAALGAVGFMVLSLRGPATTLVGEKSAASGNAIASSPDSASKTSAARVSATPIDLSYFPGHDMGFVATRPAAIFRIPGFKRYAEMLDAEIAKLLKSDGHSDIAFAVESIEQAVIGLNMTPRDPKKKQPGKIITGAFVLRSARERDWLPLVKAFVKATLPKGPELASVQFEGRVYYTAHYPRLGASVGFYFPDGRTLVYASEGEIRALIKQKQPAQPALPFVAGEDGKEASLGLYEIALNNIDHRWKFDLSSDNPEDIWIATVVEKSTRLVFHLDCGETLGLKTVVTYDTEPAAADAATALRDMLKKAPLALIVRENSAKSANHKEVQEFCGVAKLILGKCTVEQNGRTVVFQGRKKLTPDEIAAFGLGLVGG